MPVSELRQACLHLSLQTHTPLNQVLDFDFVDFYEWLEALKRYLQND